MSVLLTYDQISKYQVGISHVPNHPKVWHKTSWDRCGQTYNLTTGPWIRKDLKLGMCSKCFTTTERSQFENIFGVVKKEKSVGTSSDANYNLFSVFKSTVLTVTIPLDLGEGDVEDLTWRVSDDGNLVLTVKVD